MRTIGPVSSSDNRRCDGAFNLRATRIIRSRAAEVTSTRGGTPGGGPPMGAHSNVAPNFRDRFLVQNRVQCRRELVANPGANEVVNSVLVRLALGLDGDSVDRGQRLREGPHDSPLF